MLGIMPGNIYIRGDVGVVSRSGTLGYEAGAQMKALGIGITTSVGIGGDPINGSSFLDHLMQKGTVDLVAIGVEVAGRAGTDEIDLLAGANHLERLHDVVDQLARRIADLRDRLRPERCFLALGLLHGERNGADLIMRVAGEQENGVFRRAHQLDELLVGGSVERRRA